MRITSQLVRRSAAGPPAQSKYLDLSRKRIGAIQCLDACKRLQTLVLHSNAIDTIANLECCRELWNIDLAGNKIRTINGLSQFPFLGTLLLSANLLDWAELRKLSHIHILSLSLNGNPKLAKDPHYRKHVIDLLPHLWMLDGQLITAGERRRVEIFFENSAATSKPIRHKNTSYTSFTPSSRKNLVVTGVFGHRTSVVMMRFPLRESHNIELDQRRLFWLAEMMEEDMKIENEYNESKGLASFEVPELTALLEHRKNEIEQSNMLLLLLVACLMFNLTEDLLTATFDTAKLSSIGGVKCNKLISLPRFVLLRIVSLLLSAAIIDKESNKDGGLYPQLHQSLQFCVQSLHSKTHLLDSHPDHTHSPTPPTISSTPSGISTLSGDMFSRNATPTIGSSSSSIIFCTSPVQSHTLLTTQSVENICLLASEVVHMMCLVPLFFELLDMDQDMINMVAIATRNPNVADVVNRIKWSVLNNGGSVWEVYHQIASYLLQSTTANVFSKRKTLSLKPPSSPTSNPLPHSSSFIFQTKKHDHTPPPRSQSAGAVASFRKRHATPVQPDLGDIVLCAPERLARIVALPDQNVAVLQLNSSIQGMSGPPDSYFYTDTRGLLWDRAQGYWTRDDLASDLSAGRLHPSPDAAKDCIDKTPAVDLTRPVSQLSNISEDLFTIPSVEELSIGDTSEIELPFSKSEADNGLPIAVGITGSSMSQRTNTPEPMTERLNREEKLNLEERIHPPLTYEQWIIDKNLSGSLTDTMELSDITVSVPKLVQPELWDSKKSLPPSSHSSKPHSCTTHQHVPPPLSSPDPVPHGENGSRSVSPSLSLSPFHETKPKLVQAWTVPKVNQQPKQTISSKTRTSNRTPTLSHYSPPPPDAQPNSLILYPRSTPSPVAPNNTPTHMTAYNLHTRAVRSKYRLQSGKKKKSHNNPRKLGDVHYLSVLGASAW